MELNLRTLPSDGNRGFSNWLAWVQADATGSPEDLLFSGRVKRQDVPLVEAELVLIDCLEKVKSRLDKMMTEGDDTLF